MESAAPAIRRRETTRTFSLLARLGDLLLFAFAFLLVAIVVRALLSGYHGFDFQVFWRSGRAVLAGHSPYPELGSLPRVAHRSTFNPFVYPAPFAVAIVPLALLPLSAATAVFMLLSVAAVAAALRCLGVREWRCYAAAFAALPVLSALTLGTVTPFLLLGVAALWRWRDRALVAGALLAALVVVKVFLWPLGFWLLATRRYRATGWSVALAAGAALAGWAAIGFAGLTAYPELMHALTSLVGAEGYSPYALVLAAGGSAAIAGLVTLVGGGLLVAGTFLLARRPGGDRPAFAVGLAAALALTPVLWPHYLALLLVPIALTSRRLSLHWLAPVAFWLFAHGWSNGRLDRIVPVLLVTGLVIAAAARGRGEVKAA